MTLKQSPLPFSDELAGRLGEEQLREMAVRANADAIKGLSSTVRGQLWRFFRKSGIPETSLILLDMLLGTQRPDILTLKKIEETIDEMRSKVIKKSLLEDQERKHPAKPAEKKPELARINPNRLLPGRELAARFRKLGVELDGMMHDWEVFYSANILGMTVSKNLKLKEYSLPMPAITAQAMEAFERAHHEGHINSYMIDDGRLEDGSTLKIFEMKTLKRFKQKYKYDSMSAAEEDLNRSGLTPPIVRIVGYNRNETVFDAKDRGRRPRFRLQNRPHLGTMGLGTYIRLYHFLDIHDPEGLEMLTHYVTEGNRILAPLTVVLNNTSDEGILTIGPDPKDPRMRHSVEKAPAVTDIPDLFEAPIQVVTSHDLSALHNSGDSRYIATMETWPAPAED